jgi:hypothetical protein
MSEVAQCRIGGRKTADFAANRNFCGFLIGNPRHLEEIWLFEEKLLEKAILATTFRGV